MKILTPTNIKMSRFPIRSNIHKEAKKNSTSFWKIFLNSFKLFKNSREKASSLRPLYRSLDTVERELLSNMSRLRKLRLPNVMIPRADIIALDLNKSFDQTLETVDKDLFSRYPVIRGTLDYLIGCIETKEILKVSRFNANPETAMLRPSIRKVLFTSPNKLASHLLLEMRDKKRHLAIVVDEYGGVDGMITVEDLAAEIVGLFEDEYDDEDLVAGLPDISQDRVIVPARLSIDDFENHYGWAIQNANSNDDEKPDTVGGRVVAIAERVPARGEIVTDSINGIEFVVIESNPRHVQRIQIRRIPVDYSTNGNNK